MSFEQEVQRHGQWRRAVVERMQRTERLMQEHGLASADLSSLLQRLQQVVAQDRMVLALTGPCADGRAALMRALLAFGDAHYPPLPQAPARCPLEVSLAAGAAALRLLPIESKQSPWSLARWRSDMAAWQVAALADSGPQALADAQLAVTHTRRVCADEAQVLGFGEPTTSPSVLALLAGAGTDVPRWRSAGLQLPHPVLQHGLTLCDLPMPQAMGADLEPIEAPLADARAVLFVLSADTGLTRADVEFWRRCIEPLQHTGRAVGVTVCVVQTGDTARAALGVDALQSSRVVASVARTLGVAARQIVVLSWDMAAGGGAPMRPSALDDALAQTLVQPARAALQGLLRQDVALVFQQAAQRVQGRQRDLIDHLLELQALAGKNTRLLQQMRWRVGQEQAQLDVSVARLTQARDRQQVQLRDLFGQLGPVRLRSLMQDLMAALSDTSVRLDTKAVYHRAFDQLMTDVELADVAIQNMQRQGLDLAALFDGEQGARLALAPAPDLHTYRQQLRQIESSHAQYLGWSAFVHRLKSGFGIRVGQTLMNRLQSLFDTLLGDIEQWHKQGLEAIEGKVKELRHQYARRLEALNKVQDSAAQLEREMADLRAQNQRLDDLNDELLQLHRASMPTPEGGVPAESEAMHG